MNTMFNLNSIIRKNIFNLQPYSSARSEFKGNAEVFLDANENSFGSPCRISTALDVTGRLNRYPDPLQIKLKDKLSSIK